eukprot:jgi/Undpi1/9220/HiC_scaffold_26.g11678.m1
MAAVFLAANMANERGRRGGRAGAKSGKAGGRGRGSNQANPNPAPGRGENGGEGGGRGGGGTGGGAREGRGGRAQARRGGRGGKRVAGSDAAAGTSPAPKARKVSHPNKQTNPGREPKVLWSPGKAGGGGEAGAGSSIYRGAGAAGLGTGGDNLVTQNNLFSLASSFKERYGENVGFDEEETEGRSRGETGAKTPQTARRKRSLSGGGPAAIAEEAARSMSPSKLAAEMQKARARAREERFGADSAVNRSSSLARRAPPAGNNSAPALPSAQAPIDNANGRAVHDGNRSVNRIPSTPSPPPETSASLPRSPLPTNTAGVTAITTVSSSAPASAPGAVAGATRVTGVIGLHRASVASPTAASGELSSMAPTPPTTAPPALPIVTTIDIEEDEPSEARGSGKFVTVVDEVLPIETTTNLSRFKRPAPDIEDVVVIEPPAKRAGTSSPSAAAATAARGDAVKVHTLRLRLRADLSGDEQSLFGGVEESKSFEPPNSPVDGGVEECKGFDPPNLPRTNQKRQPAPLPSTTVSAPTVDLSAQEKPSRRPLASTVSSPAVPVGPPAPPPSPAPPSPAARTSPSISRSKSAEEVAPGVALSRESSWGPSFGIAVATEPAAATATAATALSQPVADSVKNPWVLSPEAPTFAKNLGRPLARSFSQPSDTDTAVTIRRDAGPNGISGLGRDHGTATGPGVVRPAVASSGGGGGGRGEGGAAESSVRSSGGQGGAGSRKATCTEGESGAAAVAERPSPDAQPEESVLGLRVGGRAGELLERLKREREESLDFERKLTQALLDL